MYQIDQEKLNILRELANELSTNTKNWRAYREEKQNMFFVRAYNGENLVTICQSESEKFVEYAIKLSPDFVLEIINLIESAGNQKLDRTAYASPAYWRGELYGLEEAAHRVKLAMVAKAFTKTSCIPLNDVIRDIIVLVEERDSLKNQLAEQERLKK